MSTGMYSVVIKYSYCCLLDRYKWVEASLVVVEDVRVAAVVVVVAAGDGAVIPDSMSLVV
jgi:hypothetical protein